MNSPAQGLKGKQTETMALPDIWPLFNVINIINLRQVSNTKPASDSNDNKTEESQSWFAELTIRHLRLSTYLFVAYLTYNYTFPSFYDLTMDPVTIDYIRWLIIITMRDQFLLWTFCGLWHNLLYSNNSYSSALTPFKYNKEFPSESQWNSDKFWSSITMFVSSLNKISMIYLIKSKRVTLYQFFWSYPLYSLFWLLIIPYWVLYICLCHLSHLLC